MRPPSGWVSWGFTSMHVPVLLEEVLRYLDPQPNQHFVDATAGEGGHSFAILERTQPRGRVLAVERDPELVRILEQRVRSLGLEKRLIVRKENFSHLKIVAQGSGFPKVAGILLDLGLSSWHLEKSQRGFSFGRNEPLDMRFDPKSSRPSAATLLEELDANQLTDLFRRYGDEPHADKVAKAIVCLRKNNPIRKTDELREICENVVPGRRPAIHPATRVFQALRIAVNDELNALKLALPQTLELLESRGCLVIISFHSGEDRIVKHFLREAKDKIRILTRKPLRPSRYEINQNPRARSAKMRVAERLASSREGNPR